MADRRADLRWLATTAPPALAVGLGVAMLRSMDVLPLRTRAEAAIMYFVSALLMVVFRWWAGRRKVSGG